MKNVHLSWCIGLILASPWSANSQDVVKVDGYVHNTTGKPVAGVKVSLFTTGKNDPIDSGRTDVNGYYKLNRKIESTYDIWFSHAQLDFSVVELLAENKNQHINIKMYKRGEKRSASAYHEALQAVERLLFTATSLPAPERGAMVGNYKESGAIEVIYSKALPLSDSPNAAVLQFFNDKRDILKKLERDALDKKADGEKPKVGALPPHPLDKTMQKATNSTNLTNALLNDKLFQEAVKTAVIAKQEADAFRTKNPGTVGPEPAQTARQAFLRTLNATQKPEQ